MMFVKKLLNYSLCVIVFSTILGNSTCFAQQQTPLHKKITISFHNNTTVDAFRKIANTSGCKFSYNPEIINNKRLINAKFVNKPITEIVQQILSDPNIQIQSIGNQIVLYKDDTPLQKEEIENIISPDKISLSKQRTDTLLIYRNDTTKITIYDTLRYQTIVNHYDTIRLIDTVFVPNKLDTSSTNYKNSAINNTTLKVNASKNKNRYYMSVYAAALNTQYKYTGTLQPTYTSLMQQANSDKIMNYQAGMALGYNYRKIGINSGIGYLQFNENFNYSFNETFGGFFKQDTAEIYYTITGIDTTWHYIYDSTWIPKESYQYNYQNLNTYLYLEIPISITLNVFQTRYVNILLKAGINNMFLLNQKALYINPEDKKPTILSKNDLKKYMYSWHAGIGVKYYFMDNIGIESNIAYRSQINTFYSKLPIDKRFNLIDIQLGIFFDL